MDTTLDNGDSRRHRAVGTDGGLGLAGDFQVLRPGEAMRDNCRFKGHDGLPRGLGGGDFLAQRKYGMRSFICSRTPIPICAPAVAAPRRTARRRRPGDWPDPVTPQW